MPAAQGFSDHSWVKHAVANGVVDLVQHHHVPVAGVYGLARFFPGLFDQANVFRVGLGAADLHEAAAHLLEDEIGTERLDGIELTVPFPTARKAVPMAAVVLPLPGPVLIRISPRRESVITGSKVQGSG